MAEAKPIAVFGAGSWATALSWLLAQNGHAIRWWVRKPANAAYIQAEGLNPRYLSQARLPMEKIRVLQDAQQTLEGCSHLLVAVPAAYVHGHLESLPEGALAGLHVASAIKGIEVRSGLSIAHYFTESWGVAPERYAVVTGPSHAEEVVRRAVTFLTVGSASEAHASYWAAALRAPFIHSRTSTDVEGLEFAAVMKNIYALATGLAIGLGYGDNFLSVLVSACLQELEIYLAEQTPGERRITDSAYMGDLLVTAYSEHSRNRQLGRLVGSGLTPEQALQQMNMVAEGYYAARLVFERVHARHLPIAHMVYEVLHQQVPPRSAMEALATRFR